MALQGCSGRPEGLARMLPDDVQGWSPEPPDGYYDGATLYDYIDGGAEVYRALNVKKVCARRYIKSGAPEIIVDLFDMGSSSDAFGAYHHDLREGESAGIGQESEVAEGALAFWKGRFFVSIIGLDDTPGVQGAVLEIGERVADSIAEAGAAPDLVGLLPERGLIASQVHYFHTSESLDVYHSLGEGNPLGLGKTTEGLVARYEPAGPSTGNAAGSVVIVVRYRTSADAREALGRFIGDRLPGIDGRGLARTEAGDWSGVRVVGGVLVGVFDAPTDTEAERILESIADRAKRDRVR